MNHDVSNIGWLPPGKIYWKKKKKKKKKIENIKIKIIKSQNLFDRSADHR